MVAINVNEDGIQELTVFDETKDIRLSVFDRRTLKCIIHPDSANTHVFMGKGFESVALMLSPDERDQLLDTLQLIRDVQE